MYQRQLIDEEDKKRARYARPCVKKQTVGSDWRSDRVGSDWRTDRVESGERTVVRERGTRFEL